MTSAKKIILANRDRYRHFIVLVVDSRVVLGGASRAKADVRNRVVDMNFMNSFSSLLDSVRREKIAEFGSGPLWTANLAGKTDLLGHRLRRRARRGTAGQGKPDSDHLQPQTGGDRSHQQLSTTSSGPIIRNCRNSSGCCAVNRKDRAAGKSGESISTAHRHTQPLVPSTP